MKPQCYNYSLVIMDAAASYKAKDQVIASLVRTKREELYGPPTVLEKTSDS